MCGIAGYFGSAPLDRSRLRATLSLMRNRGPDNQQDECFTHNGVHVGLLHSRLAIIDLDARADQPLTIDGCTLIFNGEIYNYLELRTILAERGVRFLTESDTEVLLQAYLAWGESCVERLEGMWAFAIFDRQRHRLFLSRDRFGEKPLYFLKNGIGFWFGSEVKFLAALIGRRLSVNHRHLMRYLVNGHKSLYKTEETFFEQVRELPAGHNLVLGGNREATPERYWLPRYRPRAMTYEEAVRGVRERLIESLRLRLRADVPIAFCLSGGIDSAALASLAAKEFGYDVAAYSIIDSDPRYDEADNIAATVADLGCPNRQIRIPKDDPFGRLERLVAYHDAPIYTISYYIHEMLSETIRADGYRVAVSGTGADELVTGYYDHFNLQLYQLRRHPCYHARLADWRQHVAPIVRNPYLSDPELYIADPDCRAHLYLNNRQFAGFLCCEFNEPFTEVVYTDSLMRNRMLNELFHEAIPVILHEDDLNSMYHSVENRSPYLDSALFDFAYSIPSEHLIRDGYAKAPLRDAVKGILNEQVRTDRHKKGFNAAFASLIDLGDRRARDRLLDDGPIFDIVDRQKIAGLFDMEDIPNSYSKFMFAFLNAKLFLEQHA